MKKKVGIVIALVIFILFTVSGLEEIPVVAGALTVVHVSEETLQVVTNINGYSEETMCDILYAVTGYHDFDEHRRDW